MNDALRVEVIPCLGIGRVLGHCFRARYNEMSEWPDMPARIGHTASTEDIEAMKNWTRTYVADVCERCGCTLTPEKP